MGLLDSVTRPAARAIMVTISGPAGLGKTSLAASFPKPIFIRAEDGLQSIPADRMPDAFPALGEGGNGADQVFDQIGALINENHDYRTLVIDSVTALDAIFVADVIRRDGRATAIQQAGGGYGAGYGMVAGMHYNVRRGAGILNTRKNMNVVFLAHSDVETIKLPDSDDYMRYTLRMHSKSLPPYVDDVDAVGLLRLVSFVRGEDGDRKKAVSTGERELIVHAQAASVSKNRFGISEPLPVKPGENPLAQWAAN